MMHTQIYEMSYYGEGGYNPEIVYRMPVWIRNFHYNKIKEAKEKEENATKKGNSPPPKNLYGPNGQVIKSF